MSERLRGQDCLRKCSNFYRTPTLSIVYFLLALLFFSSPTPICPSKNRVCQFNRYLAGAKCFLVSENWMHFDTGSWRAFILENDLIWYYVKSSFEFRLYGRRSSPLYMIFKKSFRSDSPKSLSHVFKSVVLNWNFIQWYLSTISNGREMSENRRLMRRTQKVMVFCHTLCIDFLFQNQKFVITDSRGKT